MEPILSLRFWEASRVCVALNRSIDLFSSNELYYLYILILFTIATCSGCGHWISHSVFITQTYAKLYQLQPCTEVVHINIHESEM